MFQLCERISVKILTGQLVQPVYPVPPHCAYLAAAHSPVLPVDPPPVEPPVIPVAVATALPLVPATDPDPDPT